MPEGDVAINPQTGERVVQRGGRWVPDTGGQAPSAPASVPGGIRYGTPRPGPQPVQAAPPSMNDAYQTTGLFNPNTGAFTPPPNRADSPAALALAAKREKEGRAQAAMAADATAALDALQRSRGLIGGDVRIGNDALHTGWFNGETGPLGAMFRDVPGTRANDLRAQLARIKAVLSTGKMAEMRANSPTGGAVGNPAVAEWDMLANSVANLDMSQTSDQLKGQLDFVEQHLRRLGGLPPAPDTAAPRPGRQRPGPAARAVPRGLGANVSIGSAPPRPRGVPADAHWDARARQWVK